MTACVLLIALCLLVALAIAGSPASASIPDERIYFNRDGTFGPQIWSVRPDGGDEQLEIGGQNLYMPVLAPNGYLLAYIRNGDLVVRDLETGNDTLLVERNAAGMYGFNLYPSWSPDGQTIVFRHHSGWLASVPASGGPITQLIFGGSSPSYSPDGEWIAFDKELNGATQIWKMRANGSGVQVIAGGGRNPSWSPTSSSVIYECNVHLCSADSGEGTPGPRPSLYAPSGGHLTEPDWSPDGSQIVFSYYQPGNGTYRVATAMASSPSGFFEVTHTGTSGTPGWADMNVDWAPRQPPDSTAPVVTNSALTPNPISVGQTSTLTVTASDVDSGIAGGEYFVGADPGEGSGTGMSLSDGTFSSTLAPSTISGVYDVGVRVQDGAGNWSATSVLMLVVYDPSGSFVTGAGQITPGGATSDVGDLLPGIDGASRAQFGFSIRYQSGVASVPDGSLQFRYNVGAFRLRSSGYDWLVVTNQNWAKFQGLATIDGSDGEYPFRVDARDGDAAGGTQADRFLIKIWAPGSNPDTAAPIYKATGDLLAGAITIHG